MNADESTPNISAMLLPMFRRGPHPTSGIANIRRVCAISGEIIILKIPKSESRSLLICSDARIARVDPMTTSTDRNWSRIFSKDLLAFFRASFSLSLAKQIYFSWMYSFAACSRNYFLQDCPPSQQAVSAERKRRRICGPLGGS